MGGALYKSRRILHSCYFASNLSSFFSLQKQKLDIISLYKTENCIKGLFLKREALDQNKTYVYCFMISQHKFFD